MPEPDVAIDDLDHKVIDRFRERAVRGKRLDPEVLTEDRRDLIKKLGLMDGDHLTRAAILLFHPDPGAFVTSAFIQLGYFETEADVRYHDRIDGDLFTQVDKTLDLLLTKYLKALISYEGIQRVETYPVPREALREALLNAVAHKDYGGNVHTQIRVYDDKIVFWNSGWLPEGWSEENLISPHESKPYNPGVASAFYRAGMIEHWGRGIEKMRAACKEHGIPEPELRYQRNGFEVTFRCQARAISGASAVETRPITAPTGEHSMTEQVFISYSHKDKQYLDELQTHLVPYLRSKAVMAWSDQDIAPGSKWLEEIEKARASTRVAVLLVSPNFLASDFIHDNELGPFLQKARAGDVTILWVRIRACAYTETSLRDYRALVSPPDRPLAGMVEAERDEAWVRVCQEIKKALPVEPANP
uniref:TIR domain-containing protein n=1 Tax=Candidatus Kentrum sp. FW TaxID=2126338 RepID=A0A450T6K1_9GAMM|nr:MAG: TIR domain-containing protein [Candidatus Kentron sp. FW]